MYKIPASTLFVGKNLVFVPECHSTNTLAMELSQRTPLAEGTVVVTDNQMSGRGQRGNQWLSEPGKNLTFSVIVKPAFLKADQQFLLTQTISLAVADYIQSKINRSVKIKWPNDILINERKVCGILIENSLAGDAIQFAIAGIGLNINQTTFTHLTATSFANETGQGYDLATELPLLLHAIEQRYLQLRDHNYQLIKADYLNALYRRGEQHLFRSALGDWTGTIESVDDRGRLAVRSEQSLNHFDLKEISFADKP